MTQEQRREELMGKLEDFKKAKATHQIRKDKWLRWKKSQAMLRKSRFINYQAWTYWEPDTDSDEEGDPICPRDNPEFLAMESDMKARKKKRWDQGATARKCKERGNEFMKEGDFLGAIENYEEGLEYRRDIKEIWTNKALAELKVFRWHDAIASCNKVIEYAEIFEDGFTHSRDACFKAFTRRAIALRALHNWEEAALDLEDAVKLYPKDREARDLLQKTRSAAKEASKVKKELESSTTALDSLEDSDAAQDSVASTADPAEANGPVRVLIEDSDSEDELVQDVSANGEVNALSALTAKEYAAFMQKLKNDPKERSRFCTRGPVQDCGKPKREREGRKLEIRIEEVAEPSGLDGVLKDAERCAILWKKMQGLGIQLNGSVVKNGSIDSPEDKKNEAFVHKIAPRIVEVLFVLANNNDHHCELTSAGIRHVWPLISNPQWRYSVVQLLLEWSQNTVSVKALAEFAGRYPTPHLKLLVEAITEESKENILPPGFEGRAQLAADLMSKGNMDMDGALEDMMKGLQTASLTELAISTLGNICLAGQLVPLFKEQLAPFCDSVVKSLKGRLKAGDWRLCGKTAGALANLVRLGETFTKAVQEHCVHPLAKALREEANPDSSSFLKMFQQAPGGMGGIGQKAVGRLMAALLNLVSVRPEAATPMLKEGVLDTVLPFFVAEPKKVAESELDDATPAELSARAAQMINGLLAQNPGVLSTAQEADILNRVWGVLKAGGLNFWSVKAALNVENDRLHQAHAELPLLDLSVRLLTTIIVKTPGALGRIVESSSSGVRIEELPDDYDIKGGKNKAVPAELSFNLKELIEVLSRLVRALQPSDYLGTAAEGGTLSRMRGNLSLLFAHIVEASGKSEAARALKDIDFAPLVPVFLNILRKERGKAQNNIGVVVTRLAQDQRYVQLVRDGKGFESLHQIQLPKVQAQKEREMKVHRIKGPQSIKEGAAAAGDAMD